MIIMPLSMVIRLGTLVLTLFFYGLACILPCLKTDDPNEYVIGLVIILFGWIPGCATPTGYALIAWISNVELLVSLILLGVKWCVAAIVLSLLALLGGCCSFFVTEWIRDEGGNMSTVTAIGPGVYLWFISLAIPMVGAILHLILTAKPKQ